MITPDEFAERMRDLAVPGGDTEHSHAEADELMCEVLRQLGYGKGVHIFEEMDRWYA